MANILLGVTGSVAAIYTPLLVDDFLKRGHAVKVIATRAAEYFFDAATIQANGSNRNPAAVILDEDEWPGRADGVRYGRGDRVLHIELRRWADILLIAPLDANTLAKLACGLSDNCLTCVWRAWDRERPIVLAPAMNTLMWEHPLTRRHLGQLAEDAGVEAVRPAGDLTKRVEWLNANCPRLKIIAPISKTLACEDVGVGALAERADIIAATEKLLSVSKSRA
jgi:phosphopantothenoylcysteine decarboxylase